MSERILPTLIITISVFVIGTFCLSLMSSIFTSGTNQQQGIEPLEILGGGSIGSYWTPTRLITWANATDDPYEPSSSMMQETFPGGYVMYADIIRNNTEYSGLPEWDEQYYDFVRLLRDWSNTAVSYYAIENATFYEEDGDTYSLIYPGWPLNVSTALLIEFADDSTPAMVNEQLWENNTYTLKLAWVTTPINPSSEDIPWYSIVFMIATFQYEPTGTSFDFIFSAVFNIMLAFCVFTIIVRAWHGGG